MSFLTELALPAAAQICGRGAPRGRVRLGGDEARGGGGVGGEAAHLGGRGGPERDEVVEEVGSVTVFTG